MGYLLYNQKTVRGSALSQLGRLAPAVPSTCNLVATTFLPKKGLKLLLLVYFPMILNNNN